MKLVLIESPFAGDVERNVRYARACLRDCLQRSEAGFASHLLYTQEGVLRDNVPSERALGIEAGLAWGRKAVLTAVYVDLGVSSGMKLGILRAKEEGRPVEERSIPGWAARSSEEICATGEIVRKAQARTVAFLNTLGRPADSACACTTWPCPCGCHRPPDANVVADILDEARRESGVPPVVTRLAKDLGAKIEQIGRCPDGSGFATVSMPLPKDHWLTREGRNEPPMSFKMGTADPKHAEWVEKIRMAGRYAARAATMNGKEMDFDPDALVQNLVVGMLGYWTPDGETRRSDEPR